MISQKEILIKVIENISRNLISAENELTELDSMGDADCGSGVRRGFEAVLNILKELSSLELGEILKRVGFTLAYTIGGTSGAMLGTGFIETGKGIADNKEPTVLDWINAVDGALLVIKRRGGNTKIGDKTLVDSLEPAVAAMKSVYEKIYEIQPQTTIDNTIGNNSVASPMQILPIIDAAYRAAKLGSDRTIDMIAKKGRASYVGERSKGNRDPGSLIIVIMFESALNILKSI